MLSLLVRMINDSSNNVNISGETWRDVEIVDRSARLLLLQRAVVDAGGREIVVDTLADKGQDARERPEGAPVS